MTKERRKQIRKRRKSRNKNKFALWFRKLSGKKKAALVIASILLTLMLAVVLYVAWKFSLLNTEKIDADEIIINDLDEEVGVGYTNFVLFGGDSRTGDVTKNLNTDSIIIVSLNNETKEIKMVSVYRDTLLDLSDGTIKKCNAAYSAGGATQAINMLNMNLDLNIQKYVTVDFGAVTDVIDMLGGIEIDVSEAEWQAVNLYIDETAMVAGKEAVHLTHSGLQTLDGVQATTYARIRKGVGDDYARTERQRLVIQKAFEKALKADLITLNNIIDAVFPKVATNLTMTEILGYAKSITKYSIGETSGFPFEKGSGTFSGRGSCVYPVTLKNNVSELHEFLFGTKDYTPSSKVISISNEIASIVGNKTAEPNTTWTDTSGSGGDSDEENGTTTGTTGGENTGSEGTGSEGTGSEGTGSEGTGGSSGGENTGSEGTGSEGTGGSTGSEGSGGSSGNEDSGGTGGSEGSEGGEVSSINGIGNDA